MLRLRDNQPRYTWGKVEVEEQEEKMEGLEEGEEEEEGNVEKEEGVGEFHAG